MTVAGNNNRPFSYPQKRISVHKKNESLRYDYAVNRKNQATNAWGFTTIGSNGCRAFWKETTMEPKDELIVMEPNNISDYGNNTEMERGKDSKMSYFELCLEL